jgi:hypothetical protein
MKGKHARPVIKAASVPAIVSSSHATPMLSSTASLARPSPPPGERRGQPKVLSTIKESRSEVGKGKEMPPVKPAAGDLVFGQARLRDLIKKYQEHSR